MHRSRPSTRGFTVIELLVVMGVIAVLASILLPAISAAIRNSRAAICTANEHVLLSAMMAYSASNDGFLPNPGSAWVMDGVGVADFNIGTIWPYVDPAAQTRAQVLHCPADAFEQLPTYGGGDYFCYRNFSYSLSIAVFTPDWTYTMQLRQVKHPDAHVWLYEEFAPNDQYCFGPGDLDDWLTGRHGPYGAIEHRSSYNNSAWRTSGRGNVGYFDGHVGIMSVNGYFANSYHFGPLTQ